MGPLKRFAGIQVFHLCRRGRGRSQSSGVRVVALLVMHPLGSRGRIVRGSVQLFARE
jgi:hypothetical protein